MSGFKRNQIALRDSTFAITPDEQDRYEVYTVVNPSISATWFGTTAVAGTSASSALVLVNAIADYPRNLVGAVAGSAAGLGGTWVVNGVNQFGGEITENLVITGASNGGTTVGTSIFAQVTSGTFNYGTAVGSGTTKLGVDILGTTALFGLPVKIGAATDVKSVTYTTGAGAQTVNGGTIAAFVDADVHAIKAPVTVTGTMSFQTWVKPTHNNENSAQMANLSQVV